MSKSDKVASLDEIRRAVVLVFADFKDEHFGRGSDYWIANPQAWRTRIHGRIVAEWCHCTGLSPDWYLWPEWAERLFWIDFRKMSNKIGEANRLGLNGLLLFPSGDKSDNC